ncbi:MAG: imidazolonepropionase [Phycisphaerales bacterium]
MRLVVRHARVLTMGEGSVPRRGAELGVLGVIGDADVVVEGERVVEVCGGGRAKMEGARVIEARGRVLMPGFVDAHTHACWAGDRLDEWERKRRGATYLEILKSGGGIMSTVRAVRGATQEELERGLRARLGVMLREGTTTVEVKSGYGLSTEAELKMLRAIRGAGEGREGEAWASVVATALLGHALDPEQAGFVERTIEETLPAVHGEFAGVAVDAYCEEGAWSFEDCRTLFERAAGLGHPIRVHADQFNRLGMVEWAAQQGARSVDHLEATTPDGLAALARTVTYGVALPISGFHTDGRYAAMRVFVDAGGALVIATNCNPGSAPSSSMPLAIALAVRMGGLSPAEAISACTVNAAALLGFDDRGVIAPGKRADLVLLRHTDERMLAYEVGGDPVDMVVCGGVIVGSGSRDIC